MGIFKLNGIDYMGGGGGGNTNYKELTQLEYDALTEEEKNNGTIYFITDTNSNQDGKFQPIIYSEEEREIGVWTDGKPLYQKTIIYENSISGRVQIQLGISDIESVISVIGTCKDSYDSNLRIYTVSDLREDNNNIYFNGVYNTYVEVYVPNVFSTRIINMIITLQYTKTTDSPGSGQWTPQGVPAVHYSTAEHIIGTWIDGSTLYEVTINGGSITANSQKDIDVSQYNIANVVSINGVFDNVPIGTNWPGSGYYWGIAVFAVNNMTGIRIKVGQDNNYSNCIFTMQYTKSPSQGGN